MTAFALTPAVAGAGRGNCAGGPCPERRLIDAQRGTGFPEGVATGNPGPPAPDPYAYGGDDIIATWRAIAPPVKERPTGKEKQIP